MHEASPSEAGRGGGWAAALIQAQSGLVVALVDIIALMYRCSY